MAAKMRAKNVIVTAPERLGCIYLLRNLVNGKGYAGKAFDAKVRWAGHVKAAEEGSRLPIHCAIRKYGWAAFSKKVLHYCNQSQMNPSETRAIKKHKTHVSQGGYNLTWGGDGGRMADSVIRRIARAAKKQFEDPEQRKRVSVMMKKRCADPVELQKMSERTKALFTDDKFRTKFCKAQKKRWNSLSSREAQSVRSKTQALNPATKKKQSEASRRLWNTTEHKDRMSKIAFSKYTAESKRKMSLSAKKRWASPEERASMSKAVTERCKDEAYRARLSAAFKIAAARPEVKAKRIALQREISRRPASRERQRELAKRMWKDPEIRSRLSEAIRAGHAAAKERRREAALARAT